LPDLRRGVGRLLNRPPDDVDAARSELRRPAAGEGVGSAPLGNSRRAQNRRGDLDRTDPSPAKGHSWAVCRHRIGSNHDHRSARPRDRDCHLIVQQTGSARRGACVHGSALSSFVLVFSVVLAASSPRRVGAGGLALHRDTHLLRLRSRSNAFPTRMDKSTSPIAPVGDDVPRHVPVGVLEPEHRDSDGVPVGAPGPDDVLPGHVRAALMKSCGSHSER